MPTVTAETIREKIIHEIQRRILSISLGELDHCASLSEYNRNRIQKELLALTQEGIIESNNNDGINRYTMKTETPKTPPAKTPVASKKSPIVSGINTVEIETVTVYRSKDGSIHESKEQAEQRNALNDFVKSYRSATDKPIVEREQNRIITILSAWEKFRQERIQHEGA